MRMHVEKLEKDKRELTERMRVTGRWLDHVERAYRKEERPLLAKDYEAQQENDRLTFEALRKSRIENSKQQHQLNLETKSRLSRILGDFEKAKNEILERRGLEYAEKQREASEKLREAKAKRAAAVRKAREEERLRKEADERVLREREEEEARREAGTFSYPPRALILVNDLVLIEQQAEEERLRLEREAEEAAAEAKKKEEEDKRAALVEKRRREREELDKKAVLQRQREEDAEKRRAERNASAKSQPQSSTSTPWRNPTPQGTTPSTPPRSESPAPAKYRPGAFAAARVPQPRAPPLERERTSSPAPTRTEEPWQKRGPLKSEDPAPKWRSRAVEERKGGDESPPPAQADPDGFQTVEKKNVWRPTRGRGGPRP